MVKTRFQPVVMFVVVASLPFVLGCSGGGSAGTKVAGQGIANGAQTGVSGQSAGQGRAGVSDSPAYSLTAEEFTKELVNDKEGADKKYAVIGKEKTIEIEGEVLDNKPGSDTVSLHGFRKSNDSFEKQLWCGFQKESPDYAKVKVVFPGQKIKVRGKYYGTVFDSAVPLSECALVQVGPDPAVVVNAKQLSKEYAKDSAAADAKYKDKYVRVEGVVAVPVSEKNKYDVLLECGEGELPVNLSLSLSSEAEEAIFGAMKKGQSVKIRGFCKGKSLNDIEVTRPVVLP